MSCCGIDNEGGVPSGGGGGGGGGGESWAATLAIGNTTGGTDAVISAGDRIVGAGAVPILGVGGAPNGTVSLTSGSAVAASGQAGSGIVLITGAGDGAGDGGQLYMQTSQGGLTNGDGGDAVMFLAAGQGSGRGGSLSITLGSGGPTGQSGFFNVIGQNAGAGANAGDFFVNLGQGAEGGDCILQAGPGLVTRGGRIVLTGNQGPIGGALIFTAGNSTSGAGQPAQIFAGNAGGGGDFDGGDVELYGRSPINNGIGGGLRVFCAGAEVGSTGSGGGAEFNLGPGPGFGTGDGGSFTVNGAAAGGNGGVGGSAAFETGDGPLSGSGDGGAFTVETGSSGLTGGSAGSVSFTTGDGGASGGNGGSFTIALGDGVANGGSGGDFIVTAGDAALSGGGAGAAGIISMTTGSGRTSPAFGSGGDLTLTTGGGSASSSGDGGSMVFTTGSRGASGGNGGSFTIHTGDGDSGGTINILAGDKDNGAASSGGDINITAGNNASGAGFAGDIVLTPGDDLVGTNHGEVQVSGFFRADDGVTIPESAAAPRPATGGRGNFWVRNDSPCVPMFTDDTGADFNLLSGSATNVGVEVCDIGDLDGPATIWAGAGGGLGDTYGSLVIAKAASTVTRMQYICTQVGTADDVQLLIHDASGNLVANTAVTAVALGLQTLNLVAPLALTAGTAYYLSIWANTNGSQFQRLSGRSNAGTGPALGVLTANSGDTLDPLVLTNRQTVRFWVSAVP